MSGLTAAGWGTSIYAWGIELPVRLVKIVIIVIYELLCHFLPGLGVRKHLTNEVILVTGAGSGIGRELCLKMLPEAPFVLVLVDINKQAIDDVAAEISSRTDGQVKCYTVRCDLSKREDVYQMAGWVKDNVGEVTVLVNNAGVVSGRPFLDLPDRAIELTMDVNINAHFWMLKAFLPSMIANNHGHVVTVASTAGLMGVAGLMDYCSSKFAAVGLDESLRYELRKRNCTGVHTTVVCPYFIDTGMFHGCSTKFPWFLPVLKQEYVAEKMYNAICTNQSKLVLPRTLYIMPLFRLLPTRALDEGVEFFEVAKFMDSFQGRSVVDGASR